MRKGVNKVALRLFEHNEKAYHAAVRMMEQYGKAAIVHPTGTGKSYIASKMTLGEAIVRGILPTPNYVTTVYQYQKDLARYQTRVDNLRSPGIQDVNQKYLDALRRALEQADGLDKVFEHHITNKSGKYIVFCANKEHMDEMISHVPEWFAKVNAEVAVYEAYSDDPGTDKAFADFKTDTTNRLKLLFCILSTANTLKLSKASVTSYLPYQKGVYFPSTEKEKISVGAERQRRYRAMKRWRANPTEENFWGVVVSYAGVGFKTYSGLPFSYEVRKGRNGEYTKELWIDRREKSKRLAWSSVLLALKNIKGEVVDRPKALGDIRGVTYIYGMFYRFGLIDVPDEAKEKMKKAFSKSS